MAGHSARRAVGWDIPGLTSLAHLRPLPLTAKTLSSNDRPFSSADGSPGEARRLPRHRAGGWPGPQARLGSAPSASSPRGPEAPRTGVQGARLPGQGRETGTSRALTRLQEEHVGKHSCFLSRPRVAGACPGHTARGCLSPGAGPAPAVTSPVKKGFHQRAEQWATCTEVTQHCRGQRQKHAHLRRAAVRLSEPNCRQSPEAGSQRIGRTLRRTAASRLVL